MSILSKMFPRWALEREKARHALRAFEAAKPSNMHRPRSDQGHPDVSVNQGARTLRILARDLDENNDLARGILNTLVANVVGSGIRTEPQVRGRDGKLHADTNKLLLKEFRNWLHRPEVTWEHDWFGAQRIAARSWLRDGECLVQMLTGSVPGLDHGTKIPFSIELIEADLLPLELIDASRRITQGVEKNAWGRPIAYHLHKEYPMSLLPSGQMTGSQLSDTKRVSAQDLIHVKFADRIRQTRGVTLFASIFNRLDDVKDYEDSERIAARVAAAMTAYIKKSTDAYVATDSQTSSVPREMTMQAGMIFDNLLPGEDIGMIESNRPSNQLESFRKANLRAAAAGVGSGYSAIARDYSGTYSSQRQELVETRVMYDILRSYFIARFIRPIWIRFVQSASLAGVIKFPLDVDLESIYDADFRGPSIPWIDPLKEANAESKLVESGFKSRSQVIRDHGDNPNDVTDQIAAEIEYAEELGLAFGVSKTPEPEPVDEDMEEDDLEEDPDGEQDPDGESEEEDPPAKE